MHQKKCIHKDHTGTQNTWWELFHFTAYREIQPQLHILENVAYISSKKAGQFLEAWQPDKLAISRHTEINYIYKPFRKEQLKAKGNSPDHILPYLTHITNHPDKQEPGAKSDQSRRRNTLTTQGW